MALYPTGEQIYNDAMTNYGAASILPGYVSRSLKAQNLGTGVSLNTINPMAHIGKLSTIGYMWHHRHAFNEADVLGYRVSAKGTMLRPFLTGIGGPGKLGTLGGMGAGFAMGAGIAAAVGVNNPLGYLTAGVLGAGFFGLKSSKGSAGLAGILDTIEIKQGEGFVKGGDFIRKLSGEGFSLFAGKGANSFVKISRQSYDRLAKNKFTGTGIKKIDEALSYGTELNKKIFGGEGQIYGGYIGAEQNAKYAKELKEAYKTGNSKAFIEAQDQIKSRRVGFRPPTKHARSLRFNSNQQMKKAVNEVIGARSEAYVSERAAYKAAQHNVVETTKAIEGAGTNFRTNLTNYFNEGLQLRMTGNAVAADNPKVNSLVDKYMSLAKKKNVTKEELKAFKKEIETSFDSDIWQSVDQYIGLNVGNEIKGTSKTLKTLQKEKVKAEISAETSRGVIHKLGSEIRSGVKSVNERIQQRYGYKVLNIRTLTSKKAEDVILADKQMDLASKLLANMTTADSKYNSITQMENTKSLWTQWRESVFSPHEKAMRQASIVSDIAKEEGLTEYTAAKAGGLLTTKAEEQTALKHAVRNKVTQETMALSKSSFMGFNRLISLGFWVGTALQVGGLAKRAVEHQAIRLARTAASLHNITHASFGTGVSLQTQQASTERSRAIQAITNSGINARAYLGREAAIVAGA